MAKLFIGFQLWSATSSIPVMKMLAEQAEANITRAISDADLPDAVTEEQFKDEQIDEEGNRYSYMETFYTCGSCTGLDADEVKSEYKQLISQLTRRSAFLTMFGLFEHRMVGCLNLMDHLSGEATIKDHKTVEDCHNRLKCSIGGKGIKNVAHLAAIRNIMAHSDGVADVTSTSHKRDMQAVRRVIEENGGIVLNHFNGVLMDDRFLSYVVGEFERYVGELDTAVRDYQKQINNIVGQSL